MCCNRLHYQRQFYYEIDLKNSFTFFQNSVASPHIEEPPVYAHFPQASFGGKKQVLVLSCFTDVSFVGLRFYNICCAINFNFEPKHDFRGFF